MNTGKTLTFVLASLMTISSFADRQLTQTDTNSVLYGSTNSHSALKVELSSGLYEMGGVNSRASHFLIMDRYVNDPNKFLAIMVPKRISRDKKAVGKFFQARPIKNGSAVMLSPLVIDRQGNLRIQSESQRDAKVIEIIKRDGNYDYRYILRGRNGGLDGIWGMKGSNRSQPSLNASPSQGVFASGTWEEPSVLVTGNEITLSNDEYFDQTYKIVPVNGISGKISALMNSDLDTMSEMEIEEDGISKIAVFVSGCWGAEVLLVARKTTVKEEFQISFHQISKPGLLERFFPGRLTPKY